MGSSHGKASAKAPKFSVAVQEQHRRDYRYAQVFNDLAQPGQLPMLAYPCEQTFQLKHGWWQGQTQGDAKIRGPDGAPWFRLIHTNYLSWRDLVGASKFAICNMSGEPLMILHEKFHWSSYEYEIFRLDPSTKTPILVCQVLHDWQRNLFTIAEKYDIHLHAAAGNHGAVHCSGKWPCNFTLSLNARRAAALDKKMFSFSDKYDVTLAPNVDVLLFLGIACAIDRIEHEIERKRD